MRKMFSENQIKELIKQAIASGEINPSSYLLRGIFEDNSNQYVINATFTKLNDLMKYSAIVIIIGIDDGVASTDEFTFDFKNSKVYDSGETEISLEGATIDLVNTLTGEPIASIEL